MELLKEITEYLFDGAVDYREVEDVIKSSPDSADVHIKRALSPAEKHKKKKRDINLGLANNAFGAAAGAVATKMAYDKAKTLDSKTMEYKPEPAKASKVGRALKKMKVNPKVAVVGAGGTLVGAQLANALMDAHSANYFARERTKMMKDERIKKLLDERRNGRLTSQQVIDIASRAVEKNESPIYSDKLDDMDPHVRQRLLDQRAVKETAKGKNGILIATGLLAAGGGAFAMHKAQQKDINPKIKPKVEMQPVRKPKEEIGKTADATWEGTISKVDDEKRQVFGWCSLTKFDGEEVIDKQGDYIPLDEVEKSAYDYVIHSRKGGDMHRRDGETPLHTSDLIESFVVTPEKLEKFGLEPNALPHGWWVGFKINDDSQWEAVKKGERAHFSIHGKGKRREISHD